MLIKSILVKCKFRNIYTYLFLVTRMCWKDTVYIRKMITIPDGIMEYNEKKKIKQEITFDNLNQIGHDWFKMHIT